MSELAEAKKQAEAESDYAWDELREIMQRYIEGSIRRSILIDSYRDFKLAHNTERGLRHE